MVVVGSSKGDIVAMDGATGRQLWRSNVNSELLSDPAIGEKAVVLRSVDGRLHGFDAHNGKELWSVEQQVPRLSLRGTATPIIAKELAISGFDNGKVMAVSLSTGDTVWDTALASPHGRTELDRLVDIDSAVRVVGEDVLCRRASRAAPRCSRSTRGKSGGRTTCRAIEGWRSMTTNLVRHPVRRRRGRAAGARRFGALAQRN
jgi:outer membrane protein assembly factor BamB